jgi:hypothetical protein
MPATPKTTDFQAGHFYSAAAVGALFGHSAEWARQQCRKDGPFKGARKLPGGRVWLIPGSDVLSLIGQRQMELDRLASGINVPTPSDERRAAEQAAKRLDKINGGKKTAAKRN